MTSSFYYQLLILLAGVMALSSAFPGSNNNDMETADTLWTLLGLTQGSRGYTGYSGWGTSGSGVPSSYYGNYGGGYGNVAANPPGYGNYYATNVPTYENYAIHRGHGFGSYGNY